MATKKKAAARVQSKKSAAKPVRYSASMVPELLARLQRLEERNDPTIEQMAAAAHAAGARVSFDLGTGDTPQEACNAAAQAMGSVGLLEPRTADRPRLPSAFKHGDPVFVRFGDTFVPGVIGMVHFSESSVSYDIWPSADNAPGMLNVWSGYVSKRDPDAQHAGNVPQPIKAESNGSATGW